MSDRVRVYFREYQGDEWLGERDTLPGTIPRKYEHVCLDKFESPRRVESVVWVYPEGEAPRIYISLS